MIAVMLLGAVLLAGALAAEKPAAAPTTAAPAAAASKQLYRLELAGRQTLWAEDHPQQSGSMIVFRRFPDGILVSIRRSDILRIVSARYEPAAARAIKPGGVIDLGMTGGSSGSGHLSAATKGAGATQSTAPGERSDGTALFNPNRTYRPDWDSKQVPGMNLGYPASPNDYQEGRTLAYPSASSPPPAPGDVPRARVETGEPPKAPDQ